MFNLFFALFMAFACPSHHTTGNCQGTTITTQADTGDHTGGDGGHVPPGVAPNP